MKASEVISYFLAAVIFAAAFSTHAQTEEATTTETYTDRSVTFDYPAGWLLCAECDPSGRTVALGNTESALNAATFEDFEPGDVQVLVVKGAEVFFARRLGIPLEPGLPPEPALNLTLPEEIRAEGFEFDDGRLAAEVIFTDGETGADTVIWLIDLDDDGTRGALLITGRTEDVQAAQPELLALAESFVASEVDVVGLTDDGVVLGETFANTAGTRELQYPEGWLLVENQRGVIIFATSGEALDTENVADLPRGDVVGLVYPAVSLIPEYPPGGVDPSPATIVSFYAASGLGDGYEQVGDVNTMTLGDREAAVSFSVNQEQAHERLVLAVDIGDNVATLVAFTRLGGMDDVRPVLEAVLVSVQEGDFTTAAATEEAPEN